MELRKRVGLALMVWSLVAGLSVFGATRGRGQVPVAKAPAPLATLELGGGHSGGALVGEVDGDGVPDLAFLRAGRILVANGQGRVVFDQFRGATDIVALEDLGGTGGDEVVYMSRGSRTLGAVDPRTGATLWQFGFPEQVDLDVHYVRIADIRASSPGPEVVVFPDHSQTLDDAYGYFLTSAGRLYAKPKIKNVNGNQLNYPQFAVGNVDGEGDPEVVVVGRPKLLVFDSDGELRGELDFRAGDPQGRHYGAVTLADVDDDPALEAVVVADRITSVRGSAPYAITVLDVVPKVRKIWELTPGPGNRLESIPGGVDDFDGDGKHDLAVNRFDGTTQTIEVYRGGGDPRKSGAPLVLCAVRDAFAWDAVDLDGDGRRELLASAATQAQPSLSLRSEVSVYGVAHGETGCALRRLGAPMKDTRFVTRPMRALDRRDLLSSVPADRAAVATVPVARGTQFLAYTEAAAGRRLLFGAVRAGEAVVARDVDAPGAVRAVTGTGYLVAGGDGEDAPSDHFTLLSLGRRAAPLETVASIAAGGSGANALTAADLNGDGQAELLVRLPRRRIAAYAFDAAAKRFVPMWEADGSSTPVVRATPGAPATVVVTAPSEQNRTVVVAYRADGTALWRTRLPELPASVEAEIVVGEFTGAAPLDVWVSAPRQTSWMLDGRDGRVVWQSRDVVHFDNAVATTDVNRDSIEDLVVVSNDVYGVYSGADAKPLVGPVDVRTLGASLFSTPLVAPDGTMALAGRGTLARATLEGKRLWSVARETERTNKDLRPGVAVAGGVRRIGGNFGPSDTFAAYEFATGARSFTSPHVPSTDVVAADVTGDGVDEFVFGTTEGRVVALDSATGREAWALDFQAFVGTPVIADLDGRGLCLLVPVHDATIRVYRLT